MDSQIARAALLSEVTVEPARTREDIAAGMEFCGDAYRKKYNTCWKVPPDVLFLAKLDGKIVGTGGLELGWKHRNIGAEKYFPLTPSMRSFIALHRSNLAEFGRFSSLKTGVGKVILHAVLCYCQHRNIEYLFAWANPSVHAHSIQHLGVQFWEVNVEVNRESIEQDKDWITPPLGFFIRKDPPTLLLGVIPFWEIVNQNLAASYGKSLDIAAWFDSPPYLLQKPISTFVEQVS